MKSKICKLITLLRTALPILLAVCFMVTQAFPLSDAALIAKPKSKKEISAPVPVAQINTPKPDKETNGMTPRPYCQQSAVMSIQASGIAQAPVHTKAHCLGNVYGRLTTDQIILTSLPNSRGLVHTDLAKQCTLLGAYPSGTS